jgi:hypothetical protein
MKRRNVLKQRAEKMARSGLTPEKIARRIGIDRRQARELLKQVNGDASGR